MRSRSSANAARVGEGSSGRSRRAFAERVAYSARLAFSSSSVCSRTRSAATERERESLASPRVCVAISRKANRWLDLQEQECASSMGVRERLHRVLWIGGGTGAGKSSAAMALAERHGLFHYDYDWHDSRDHAERTRADRHPHRAAFLAMSIDERWILRTPREMANEAIGGFRERFEMVLEDLAALPPDRHVVAEGFGLLPDLVQAVIASPRQAIFLL